MIEINREYSTKWPKITEKKDPLEGAENNENETDKFKKYFDSSPADY
jgi:ferredoxin